MQEENTIERPYGRRMEEDELMRMWMVNPKMMCHYHLLGEHRELHAIVGSLRIQNSFQGYIDNNLVEVKSIEERHEWITEEMTVRGYKHRSPLEKPNFDYLPDEHKNFRVDRESSFNDLYSRCEMCRWRSYLFYLAGYDLLNPFYTDTVVVFKNEHNIWGLKIRELVDLRRILTEDKN
jgi:hypothetical protein